MSCKILFLIPPLMLISGENSASYTRRFPHLGIAYMTAVLKQNGLCCENRDMNLGYSSDQILQFIKNSNVNLICITIFSAGYKDVYSLIDFIKSHCDALVVVGGPHISTTTKEVLEETRADFAIIGEGEYTLLELVNEITKSNPKFEKIKGLIWRQGSKILVNEKRPYIQNLDILPFPDFESFELEKYLCYIDKRLPIVTSRGCPFHCNYCCTWLSMGRRFRARSPDKVVDEERNTSERRNKCK
ncbi:MAG: cobalamin-dependent protein [Methanophagales archaeon]|nr:cobalamin-dependent protein [Methanophagales archaeon]